MYEYRKNPLYADRYEKSSNWVRVLPVAGRPLQSAELIEIQSIAQANAAAVLSTQYSNGSILRGLVPSLVGSIENTSITLNISEGSIYLDATSIDLEPSSLTIPTSGTHTIGVLVAERIITEEEDPSLRDPSRGGSLYGTEGASRLLWEGIIVVNNPNSFPLYQVRDGVLIDLAPSSSNEQEIALYNYERNGNYRVNGLNVVYSRFIPSVSESSRFEELNQRRTELIRLINSRELEVQAQSTKLDTLNNTLLITPPSPRYEDLLILIEEARELLASMSLEMNSLLVDLANVTRDLENIIPLSIDREQLLVSPGVAYVEGYRVEVNNSTLINIPKSLPTETITNASYRYQGTRASTSRTLLLGTASNLNQVKSTSLVISLEFFNVPYEDNLIPIRVSYLIDINRTEINNIQDLVKALRFANPTPSYVNYSTRSGLTIPEQVLRELVSRVITLESIGPTLVISSRSNARPISFRLLLSNPSISASPVETQLIGTGLSEYQLGYRPVARVKSITSEVELRDYPITRSATKGGVDRLGDDTVVSIGLVYQGDVVYVEGRDYRLIDHSSIDWSPRSEESIEPQLGSTYYVSYIYTRELNEEDYELRSDSIRFSTIYPGLSFYVTYEYYLSIKGVVTINRQGLIGFLLGSASREPIAPTSEDLILTSFRLYRDGVELIPVSNKAWTIAELNSLSNRVKRLGVSNEIIKAQLVADLEVIREVGQLPLRVFNESFLDLSSLDLDTSTTALYPSLLSIGPSINKREILIGGSIETLPYSSTPYILQDKSTKRSRLGAIPRNGRGVLGITPQNLFVSNSLSVSPIDPISIDPITKRSNDLYINLIRSSIPNLFLDVGLSIRESISSGRALPNIIDQDENSYTYYLSRPSSIPSTRIVITATELIPNSEGYKLFLSGQEITNYLAIGDTLQNATGLRANREGVIRVSIQTPPGMGPGVQSLELIGPRGYCSNTISVYNNTTNQSILGALDKWELDEAYRTNEVLPISSPNNTRPEALYPSLIQSFINPSDSMVTAIGLKLAAISTTSPIRIGLYEYRGIPSKNLIGIGTITNPTFSSSPNSFSRVEFDRPIYLKANRHYSIGVICNSSGNELFSSVMGEPDLSGAYSIGNLHQGDLWESINGSSLEIREDESLTYVIDRALFNTQPRVVDLGSYGLSNSVEWVTHACINSRDICPPLTSIQYQYSVGEEWIDIKPNIPFVLIRASQSISIRAVLSSNSSLISPSLIREDLSITLMNYRTRSSLLSKRKQVLTPYSRVEVLIDHSLSQESSISLSISADGSNWIDLELEETKELDTVLPLVRSVYKHQLTNPSNDFYYRIEIVNSPRTTLPTLINQVTSYVY